MMTEKDLLNKQYQHEHKTYNRDTILKLDI